MVFPASWLGTPATWKSTPKKIRMKIKSAFSSAFSNPRLLFSFVLCSIGVLLLLLAYGASTNAVAQPPASAPDAARPITEENEEFSPADSEGRFVHLIQFSELGVVQRTGHNSGEQFKTDTPQAQAALGQIKAEQAVHIQAVTVAVARPLEVTHRFMMTHSGI